MFRTRSLNKIANYVHTDRVDVERFAHVASLEEIKANDFNLNIPRYVDTFEEKYTLGMAYQLTGDKKYADRAWLDFEQICVKFPDWHPSHDIDVGEMAAGAAIGYDWMWDAFSEEQRRLIEEGIYRNGMYHTSLAYQTRTSPMAEAAYVQANHNTIVNSGSLMMAIALFDVYPNESAYMIKNAMRAHERYIIKFAPDGNWFEGVNYWELATQYLTKTLSVLQTAFGTTFGLEDIEGLSETAEFIIYMQSPQGVYAHSDSPQLDMICSPEMFWMSKNYNDMKISNWVLTSSKGKFAKGEDYALALLFFDPDASGGDSDEMPTDRLYYTGTFTARKSWTETDGSFVGIHAGATVVAHSQLDVGSFIFDSAGVRWADDMGMGNYNAAEGVYWDSSENGRRWELFKSRAESHNTVVVNPSLKPDHRATKDSYGKITIKEDKPRGVITTVDMTTVLWDVKNARRGFFYTDERESLVIRDELNLSKESDVYWFMMTEADGEINGNQIVLKSGNEMLKVDFVTNGDAEVTFAKAAPLSSSPVFPNDSIPDCNRLAIKVHGSGKLNITVKLTPCDLEGTPVSDYDESIDLWKVPDGALPIKPVIYEAVIDGVKYSFAGKTLNWLYVEGETESVPEITVPSDEYNVQIEKSQSLDTPAKIVVIDKNDPKNKAEYLIVFKKIPKPHTFNNMISYPIYGYEASEEPQKDNTADKAFDNNLSTRWSAEGVGQYLIFDLKEARDIDSVALAFYVGDARKTKLSISTSEDGLHYQTLYTGLSSGTTADYEIFDLGQTVRARYVKITCDGNTSVAVGGWNSISEAVITKRIEVQ